MLVLTRTCAVRSEVFDQFMHVKFGSFKRYGCEGAESMLAGMEAILCAASQQGTEQVL